MVAESRLHKGIPLAFAIVATLAGLTLLLAPRVGLNAKGLAPVIPVQSTTATLPLLDEALRDPELAKHKPDYEGGALRLAEEIREYLSDLGRAQGARKAELHKLVYETSVSLAYYLEDTLSGRLEERIDPAKQRATLANVRRQISTHAKAFARLSTNKAEKAKALYHASIASYQLGMSRGSTIEALRQLVKQPLPAPLSRRAQLLVAVHDLDGKGRAQAIKTLRSIAGSLTVEGSIATRLAAGRGLAAVNKKGQRFGQPDKAYRSLLWSAGERASSLSSGQKEQVLAYMIGVWQAAERDWNKPPFPMQSFSSFAATKGIIERAALADWHAGRAPQALRKYRAVSSSLSGNPLKATVDLRILDLERTLYAKSRDPRSYEKALLATGNAYLDTGLLGYGHEAQVQKIQAEIRRRHKSLAFGEIGHAKGKQISKAERLRAIKIAETYSTSIDDAREIESIKAEIAAVHALAGNHRDAVSIYRELAEATQGQAAARYYTLAIASQTQLAKWSVKAPWNNVPAGPASEREELLTLYAKLAESRGKGDWYLLAQRGLLEISLSREQAAFDLWNKGLAEKPQGEHAAAAAGWMLSTHLSQGRWDEVERLARLCSAKHLVAIHKGRPLNLYDVLALALLEGGKAALEAGDSKTAVAKLGEFVAKFKKAKNRDQGHYLLARAYHQDSQFEKAIKTLQAFASAYPQSPYYRQALLDGGDWSVPMAFEENAFYFYNRFLERFAKDEEARRVREALVALYLGRELYAQASAVLDDMAQDHRADADSRVAARLIQLEIEEKQGSERRALQAADKVLTMREANAEARAMALATKARLAVREKKLDVVRQIERQLVSLGEGSFAVEDALGEVRFYLAEAASKGVVKEYFNLALKDPSATLEERHQAFKRARAAYRAVCEAGQTSYCAPAMSRLARLSEEFLRSLEDISVQDTLAKEVIARFQAKKQAVLNDAASTSQTADAQSLAEVSKGTTNPDWTQEVLWQNSSDWNFDRVTGETGNGFVQWTVGE